jgi:hypothetical protein
MDNKYISRNVPLTKDKLDTLDSYRGELEQSLGFKVSLSDAIVHAVKTAKERGQEITILSEELTLARKEKYDER